MSVFRSVQLVILFSFFLPNTFIERSSVPIAETRYILQGEILVTQNSDVEGRMLELCSEMILEPVLQNRLLSNLGPTSLRFEVITLTIVNWVGHAVA